MINGSNIQMQNLPMNIQFQMQMQNMQNIPMQNNMQINNQSQNMQFNNLSQVNVNNLSNSLQSKTSINDDEKKSNTMQNGKYTCRFEIQIENDKEFQVARRLIGSKVIIFK
jgi:hypothetical protein